MNPLALPVVVALLLAAWFTLDRWRTTRAAVQARESVRQAQTAHGARRKVEPPTDAMDARPLARSRQRTTPIRGRTMTTAEHRRMVGSLTVLDRTMTELRERCTYRTAYAYPESEAVPEAAALARRLADVAERLAEDLQAGPSEAETPEFPDHRRPMTPEEYNHAARLANRLRPAWTDLADSLPQDPRQVELLPDAALAADALANDAGQLRDELARLASAVATRPKEDAP